jgi:hypothetical protein
MKPLFFNKLLAVIIICMLSIPLSSKAYSVLTHEAVVDASWEKSIKPLLKQKYPGITEEQLKDAHAYAYGGAIAPDMGYFPFGSHFFTNLVHYVRSGDFVSALLNEAQDANEYAFALGFLCHYNADRYGHFLGTNRAVPIVYPEMKEKFGDLVTYEENRISHSRMEFAFDVLETAKGNYSSKEYHFIGFQVSQPVLERAFLKTYGLNINDLFSSLPLAISTFRWSVNSLFPKLTKAAWAIKKDEILKSQPTATSRSFSYKMQRANYKHEFGEDRQKIGIFPSILSVVIRVLPKVGPLKSLKFKAPGPEAEKIFIRSFDTVIANCASSMQTLAGLQQGENIRLPNVDFDTGQETAPGEYQLANINYGNLLLKLQDKKYEHLTPELKQDLINYCSDPKATSTATRKSRKEKQKIYAALEELKKADIPAAKLGTD